MADLDIAPDLNKAPPHVEGDLLRQGSQSIFGRKSWKKYFFIVLKDKLNYYSKRDDYRLNKEPEAYIRMSQVVSITEAVFNGVPKKHHLNCGFSVEAFHPVSDQKVTLNLLAETPEDMRYWVFALRYIKAYHSKIKTRETVMNDEAERKILEKLLCMDNIEDEESLVWGEYSLNEEAASSTGDDSSSSGANVLVFFEDGSKTKIHMESTDTTSDLLDKDEVKKHLTSSAAHVCLIDSLGNDMILKPDDRPALFPGKMQKLYALDHIHRVLPIFYTKKDFECIVVTTSTTASRILDHRDISVLVDVEGITNHGLFLKSDLGEEMFDASECPCDLLFDRDSSGAPVRQSVGKLVVRNKSLGGGRTTGLTKLSRRPRPTIYKPNFRSVNEEQRILEVKYEEEQAQSKALDLLWNKQRGHHPTTVPVIEGPSLISTSAQSISDVEVNIDGEEWVIATESKKRSSSPSSSSITDKQTDSRDLEDTVVMSQANGMVRKATAPASMETRKRSAAISDMSPKVRSRTAEGGGKKDGGSPLMSPRDGSPSRGRSKSPGRKLPDVPVSGSTSASGDPDSQSSMPSPFRRRNATRTTVTPTSSPNLSDTRASSVKVKPSVSSRSHGNSTSNSSTLPASSSISVSSSVPASFAPMKSKGPTIRFSGRESPTPPLRPTSPAVSSASRWEGGAVIARHSRSPTLRVTGVENLSVKSSRSSMFGRSTLTSTSMPAESHQFSLEPKEKSAPLATPTSANGEVEVTFAAEKSSDEPTEVLRPMVIDFTALQVSSQLADAVKTEEMREDLVAANEAKPGGKPLPIKVTSPNLLKMILLQSSEAHDPAASAQPMDFIQLSGVSLSNHKGVWSVQEGYNFHDELPPDCEDHTETFRLPGGIRAIYNHTHKRWHVLPPSTSSAVPSGDNSMDDSGSTSDHGQESQADKMAEASQMLYLSKKVLVTEVGTAFHEVVEMFATTRDMASKKKIGSDMMNPTIGHLIRGHFCSSLATLLLDGLRPYRFQGIVQDDIWKITIAFCNSAGNDPSCALVSPSIEKLIFQPINALKSTMKDNNIKFRTFVCLAMSRGMLTGWLEALPKQTAVLQKFYLPSGFLYLVSENPAYQQLFQQMLLTLEPMIYLPFDLSIDFESRHMSSIVGPSEKEDSKTSFINPNADMEDGREDLTRAASPAPPTSTPRDQSPSQVRSHVVIKTHAATGQRTTAGNVLNAVWDTSPLPSPSHSPTLSGPASAKSATVNEIDGTREVPVKQLEPAKEEKKEEVNGRNSEVKRQQVPSEGTADMRQTFKRFGDSLLKKVSDGLQQINRGGAITGAPPKIKGDGSMSPKEHSPPPPPPPPPVSAGERVVEALYTNICDDTDELCFNKGDKLIVKEQINEEWLICSYGNKTGIVPMNYITPVS